MNPVVEANNQKAITQVSCVNFCVCQADGTCWTPTANDVSVILYPYCDGNFLMLKKNFFIKIYKY